MNPAAGAGNRFSAVRRDGMGLFQVASPLSGYNGWLSIEVATCPSLFKFHGPTRFRKCKSEFAVRQFTRIGRAVFSRLQLLLSQFFYNRVATIEPAEQVDFPAAFAAKWGGTGQLRPEFLCSGNWSHCGTRQIHAAAASLRLRCSYQRLITDGAGQKFNHGGRLLEWFLGRSSDQHGISHTPRTSFRGRMCHHQPCGEIPRGPDVVTAASMTEEYFLKFPMNRAASFPEAS